MPSRKTHEVHQHTLDLSARPGVLRRTYVPFVPGPNPELPAFIRAHATPYDPATDHYSVPAFERDLVVDKSAPPKAIYDMHSYWSKKHWAAIREYIRHYLPERYYPRGTGLVLDCFSGSGMTGVAAMMEERPCVLVDASPAAAFISHCYTHPVEPQHLRTAYDRMLGEPYPSEVRDKVRRATGEDIHSLQEELDWLYATKCDRCGGDATTEYVVNSQRFQCPNCAEVVPLFDCPQEQVPYVIGGRKAGKTQLKKKAVCPHCLARSGGKPSRDFVISTRTKTFGAVPVLTHYRCLKGCRPVGAERRHDDDGRSRKGKYFQQYDLGKLELIEQAAIPHPYPDRKMMDVEDDSQPWGVEWRPGRDFRNVKDLYTKRNLWALAAVRSAIARNPDGEVLNLVISTSCLWLSRMNRYRPNSSFKSGILNGTYYLPQISLHQNVGRSILPKVETVVRGEAALTAAFDRAHPEALVSQEAAVASVSALKDESLDYVFTDPPYVDKLQYGELNFVWESWLGFDGRWLDDEVVVNPFRSKSIDDWDGDMRQVLGNLYRALKPGRWISLCYHDTDPGTWVRVQDMLLDAGLEIHTVTVLDPLQKSNNQLTAEKVAKGDLVVNCRKPRPGEGGGTAREEASLVSQRVRDIVIDALGQAAGQTRDHLWDLVLKRLLARGQLAAHRFDNLLAEVAFKSESGRWFLKEEFESLSENDVRNEEQAGTGLTRFARLRMAGVPAALTAVIVLQAPHLAGDDFNEDAAEQYIRQNLLKGSVDREKFKLGGRMKGVEFYDCLFFYLTKWLKGRAAGKTPRRNLADFLDEYLVRFKEGDKWLYRVPDEAEAALLKKARQTGLGRRIRQFVAFVNGLGDFPAERRPDVKTLYMWLKHCANFGLPDEGIALFERGGLAAQLHQLQDELRYDAEDYYAQCRRRTGRAAAGAAEDDEDVAEGEEE